MKNKKMLTKKVIKIALKTKNIIILPLAASKICFFKSLDNFLIRNFHSRVRSSQIRFFASQTNRSVHLSTFYHRHRNEPDHNTLSQIRRRTMYHFAASPIVFNFALSLFNGPTILGKWGSFTIWIWRRKNKLFSYENQVINCFLRDFKN